MLKKTIISASLFVAIAANAQTQIIAHRGYWQTKSATTENSITALKNAQNLKVYGSEFDVRMSKDGKLVINHDEHHGKMEISETRFCDLRKLKLSNGEKFPTLKNYLKQGKKDNSVKLIVEIKPGKTPELENEMVRKTLDLVKKLNLEKQCEFISFSKNICLEIEKTNPEYIVQYLAGDLSPKEIKDLKIDGIDYHYKVFLEKHPEWLSEAKSLGLITNAWTVNDINVYQKLKDQGIGFITTNIPEQLKNK